MGVAAALSRMEHERLSRVGSPLLRTPPATMMVPPPEVTTPDVRAATRMKGRCSLDGGPDARAVLIEVSTRGFAMSALTAPREGQRVVADFGRLGLMSGRVERVAGGTAHVANNYSEAKRAKLAELVAWLVDNDPNALQDERRKHPRAIPRRVLAQVDVGSPAAPDPRPVTVLNVSQSGAALAADFRPEEGGTVVFGARHPIKGKVVRCTGEGFTVEFVRLLPFHRLDPEDGF